MNNADQTTDSPAPNQELLLKRMKLGWVSYATTLALAALFCALGYLDIAILVRYGAAVVVVNALFYLVVIRGMNLRFSDPTMTFAQIYFAMAAGLYVMYYAQQARGVFLLLSVSAIMYGLFQMRTRVFLALTGAVVASYAVLIALLVVNRPNEIVVQVEVLQLFALAACLLQFSSLGGHITELRGRVKQKNSELESRNRQLELAFVRIEELAMRDELTGVFNRRHLMDTIRIEKQRCDRTGRTSSICILDIDFFKNVNDKYGHLAGDQVLREIAATASAALRQTDCFGRYGGEEFACILTDTSSEGAMITAERIRASIAQLRFPMMDQDLRVTISIGIADFARNEDTSITFQRADEALYQAKQGGRNRCVAASVAPEPVPG
jgi:diguanylate cyclase (GGDEF)-like protein